MECKEAASVKYHCFQIWILFGGLLVFNAVTLTALGEGYFLFRINACVAIAGTHDHGKIILAQAGKQLTALGHVATSYQ